MSSWFSASIISQFTCLPPHATETDYYGPFNKLLHSLFPPDSRYSVVPRLIPSNTFQTSSGILPPSSFGAIGAGASCWSPVQFMYEIMYEDKPILVVYIKGPNDILYPSMREAVDKVMRSRMRDIQELYSLPSIAGVIFMGRMYCCYVKHGNTAVRPPLSMPYQPNLQQLGLAPTPTGQTIVDDNPEDVDLVPRSRWGSDIMDDHGARKFLVLVEGLKAVCAARSEPGMQRMESVM
ncbi:hypothetical protein CC1G_08423 [Coprinopsis cinerea okayama7|uniref:Uncharacterized protein n=1 Tax=Coprinopsis cinerea (strain Okayama-7 / 130 / ATCC MYA-4618 / FGSC 9003) TaxID=240176 RepID=A8NAQ4_COPC7|nr:hypothetical protein CC1G_08423 [Coprinopsis cinerea okayama7\|eukprot:XP_001831906.1 hypothetical protein CC1G_08423 [Coprinopsis cinerea okayama7\